MSRIKSSGTKLEEKVFALLEDNNIRFIKYPSLYGKPDCQIGKKLVIFIDSDFWHSWHFKEWKNRLPQVYWVDKIARNIKRDKKKFRILRSQGCNVLRIWEHTLKDKEKVINRIRRYQSTG